MIEDGIQNPGGLVFLGYAFPVIGYCNKIPIEGDEVLEFEKMLREGGQPSIKRLEELFPDAVKHLKSWSEQDVRHYWLVEHNKIVTNNPPCKVYGGEVRQILGPVNGEVCSVKVGNLRGTPRSYIPLAVGDLVTIHVSQVAEKLPLEEFNKYFRR